MFLRADHPKWRAAESIPQWIKRFLCAQLPLGAFSPNTSKSEVKNPLGLWHHWRWGHRNSFWKIPCEKGKGDGNLQLLLREGQRRGILLPAPRPGWGSDKKQKFGCLRSEIFPQIRNSQDFLMWGITHCDFLAFTWMLTWEWILHFSIFLANLGGIHCFPCEIKT